MAWGFESPLGHFPQKIDRNHGAALVIGIILIMSLNNMASKHNYALPRAAKELLEGALARHGLRGTRHRELIFGSLLARRDHPTAEEVYVRVKAMAPTISLATVYNCLETLVQCGLVRAVNHERDATRYCPNLSEHAHFHDRRTGRIYDIDLPEDVVERLKELLPEGYQTDSLELNFHGQSAAKPKETADASGTPLNFS